MYQTETTAGTIIGIVRSSLRGIIWRQRSFGNRSQAGTIMNESKRPTIFRQKSWQQHRQRKNITMIPRFISSRVFLYLWLLLVVLVISNGALWLVDVPVYTSGQAIVVDHTTLIAFFPPEHQPHLYEGQSLFLQISDRRMSGSIIRVMSDISTPEAVGKQYELDAYMTAALTQPAAVAVARLHTDGMDANTIYEVEVDRGKRKMLSLLPLLSTE